MIYPDSFISAEYEYAEIDRFVLAPFFRKNLRHIKPPRRK